MEKSYINSTLAFEAATFGPEYVKCETSSSFTNMEDVLYEVGDFEYNFGDFISFPYLKSGEKKTNMFIIGKNNHIYKINDKDIIIPYEITKYLKNSLLKFSNYKNYISKIHLRYDDTFIEKNINNKKHKILKDWKIILSLKDNKIIIHFDDTTSSTFNLNKINASKINYWYESSKLKQSKIDFDISIPLNKKKKLFFFKKNIPFTWNIQENNITTQEGFISKNYVLEGPEKYKNKVIKSINNYLNFNF